MTNLPELQDHRFSPDVLLTLMRRDGIEPIV